jgi:hypothetical protein
MIVKRILFLASSLLLAGGLPNFASAAYHHMGESDAPKFLKLYPDAAGTKLDTCTLCHSGGTDRIKGKNTAFGSCQWCHYRYGYDGKGDKSATLNSYGREYRNAGRSTAALKAIQARDSDSDGYSNIDEIRSIRYPGDAKDDPSKTVASFRIFTREQLRSMPQHSQFLLMNASKDGDYYAEYSGVLMEYLLGKAGIAPSASRITVYSPDGYSQGHPMEADNSGDPPVKGAYPTAPYYYAVEADKSKTSYGWCDYSSSGTAGRKNGALLTTQNGLRLLLALRIDDRNLVPGTLGASNRLTKNSEGPYRVIAPQQIASPPDQPSTNPNRGTIWPYDFNLDHNAGTSTKCATIIKVEPLPTGTTDIDVLEAGWGYIDQGKVIIYGNLQGPRPVSPENRAVDVVWKPAVFSWEKSPGVEAQDIVSYRLDYTSEDPSRGQWKSVVIPMGTTNSGRSGFPGAGLTFFGVCGLAALTRVRSSRWFASFLLVGALVAVALASYGSATGTSGSRTPSPVSGARSISVGLEAGTTYWWRVVDVDRNGGSATSEIFSFTTGN